MIAGKKYQGPVVDIWSLGVILFALVSGYLPFEDPNTSALYKKILAGDYKPPRFISSDVKDLIRRILETDPRKRFTIDDIRRHAWYQQVPEAAIPREVISDDEKLGIHLEILNTLESKGLSKDTVMDALKNHAFNATTANYYLLEQKIRSKLLQERKKSEDGKSGKAREEKSVGLPRGKVAAPPPQPKAKDRPTRPTAKKVEALKVTAAADDVVSSTDTPAPIPNETKPADIGSITSSAGNSSPQSQTESSQVTASEGGPLLRVSGEGEDEVMRASNPIPAKAEESRATEVVLPPLANLAKGKSKKGKRAPAPAEDRDNDFDDSTVGDAVESAPKPAAQPSSIRDGSGKDPRSAIIEKLFSIQPQMFTQQKLSELRQEHIKKALQQRHQGVRLERIEKKPHLVRDQLDAPQTLTLVHQAPNKEAKAPAAILSLLKLKYPKFAGESTKVTMRMPKAALIPQQTGEATEMSMLPQKPQNPAPSDVRPVSRHIRARSIGSSDKNDMANALNQVREGDAHSGVKSGQNDPSPQDLPQQSPKNVTSVAISAAESAARCQNEEIRPEAPTEAAAPRKRSVMSNLLASIIS